MVTGPPSVTSRVTSTQVLAVALRRTALTPLLLLPAFGGFAGYPGRYTIYTTAGIRPLMLCLPAGRVVRDAREDDLVPHFVVVAVGVAGLTASTGGLC